MENSYELNNGNRLSNGLHSHIPPARHSPRLSWLDIRVFYVRFSRCEIDDDSTPEYLTLNHIPLDPNTLVEINGVRASIYDDGVSTLLRRDRLDKKSEEVTFVTTDSIRLTGSVKFEVLHKNGNVLVLSGVLGGCDGSNGCVRDDEGLVSNGSRAWNLSCETDLVSGSNSNGFLKGKEGVGSTIEVYVAGSFLGNPIILTKSTHVGSRKKMRRKGSMLNSIAETGNEVAEEDRDAPSSRLGLQVAEYPEYKPEHEGYNNEFYHGTTQFLEGEDEELSWFNAGVRVGVGIGLSICVGVGIGVGLMVKTYQGATRGFRRRPM